MGTWTPAAGYERPDRTVTDARVREFEATQLKDWREWFGEFYPDFEVLGFRLLGVRHYADGKHDRVMEWGITVRARKTGEERCWMHGEEADHYGGTARNYPHHDDDMLDYIETNLDVGPANELLVQDMYEDFGIDPKTSKPMRE